MPPFAFLNYQILLSCKGGGYLPNYNYAVKECNYCT